MQKRKTGEDFLFMETFIAKLSEVKYYNLIFFLFSKKYKKIFVLGWS